MKLPRIRFVTLLKLAVVGAVVGAAAIVYVLPKRSGIQGWNERAAPRANTVTTDAALARAFGGDAARPGAEAYEALAKYFLEGWAGYRTPGGERAHYPGAPSENGRRMDGLEGFARMFPMAGVWLASGRPATIATADGPLDLPQAFARGLAVGTDPKSPAYWGPIGDYGQAMVEASDVALGLWLARESVWPRLAPDEQRRVVEWLTGALRSRTHEGNWQLFPLVVHRALKALGADVSRWDERMTSSWEFFKTFHRGEGWFFDPPNGFDYYNAWSIHYAMFWLQRIDPAFDPAFIARAQAEFTGFYKHFFGPQGQPPMGRSVCYRMAAPVPLLTATALAPEAVSKGEAMRALDLTWSVFIRRGAVADGAVTQGFCGTDLATLARYSGPASCLWSLRSLVVAFGLDRELGLFAAERAPLPVEKADYSIAHATTGWTITGDQRTGRIDLTIAANPPGDGPPIRPYGARQRVHEWLVHAPRRPDNRAALYGRHLYSTDPPAIACVAPAAN
jgi:hypothetical protein